MTSLSHELFNNRQMRPADAGILPQNNHFFFPAFRAGDFLVLDFRTGFAAVFFALALNAVFLTVFLTAFFLDAAFDAGLRAVLVPPDGGVGRTLSSWAGFTSADDPTAVVEAGI
jgi:hypothetical protein